MQQAPNVGIGPAVSRTEWKGLCLERQEADPLWDGSPIRRASTWGVSLAVLPTPPLSIIVVTEDVSGAISHTRPQRLLNLLYLFGDFHTFGQFPERIVFFSSKWNHL